MCRLWQQEPSRIQLLGDSANAGTYLTNRLSDVLREELGIGLAEQDLLKQTEVNQSEIALSALARHLYCSKAGVTKMVDRLEKAGLVVRRPFSRDRRVVSVTLTQTGKKKLDDSRQVLLQFLEANFRSHLSDQQIIDLREALRALLEGLGRYESQIAHLRGKQHDG